MNLINERTNVDVLGLKGLIKIISLIVIGSLFALGFSWFFRLFLTSGDWMHPLWSALYATGFLVVFTLQTFFIRSTRYFALASFLQSIALFGSFFAITVPIIVLFVVTYSLLFSATYGGRKVLDNMLRVDFWSISKLIVPKGVVVITLLVSVLYPLHLQAHPDELPVSQATFGKALSFSNVFVRYFYKDFDATKSVDEFARTTTEKQIDQLPQAQAIQPVQKAAFVKEGMKQFYLQLFNFTGTQINPQDPISKVLYTVLEKKFGDLKDEVKLWIFIIVGVLIAISIVSFIMPIRIIIGLLAYFFYEVMLALGFARITIEEKPKETIILD